MQLHMTLPEPPLHASSVFSAYVIFPFNPHKDPRGWAVLLLTYCR